MLPASVRVMRPGIYCSHSKHIPQPLAVKHDRRNCSPRVSVHPLISILRNGRGDVRAGVVSSGTGMGKSKVPVARGASVSVIEPQVWTEVGSYHFMMVNGSHIHARVSASTSGDFRIVVGLEYLSSKHPCYLHWYFFLTIYGAPCPYIECLYHGATLLLALTRA
jgi:hypothetical protein